MLIMVYICLTHRPHDGFILWTCAYALWTFSSVLFALRGSIPDLLSIVVMNLIRVGAYVILVNGLRRFFDQPPSRFNLVLYGALVLGLIYATYIVDDIRVRSFMISVVLGTMALQAGVELIIIVIKGSRIGAGFTAMTLIAIAANELLRAVLSAQSSVNGDYYDPDVIVSLGSNLYLLITLLLLIILTCSLILLVSERSTVELRSSESILKVLANTDPLTGVSNAREFVRTAQTVMSQSIAGRTPMALIIFDIDFFKDINDQYGHPIGDVVLKRIVGACETVLRRSDLIARMGGDEFVVLLPNTKSEQVRMVIRRLTEAVAQLSLIDVGVSNHLSISVGSATLDDDDTDINALMRRADRAMYRAKALAHRKSAA